MATLPVLGTFTVPLVPLKPPVGSNGAVAARRRVAVVAANLPREVDGVAVGVEDLHRPRALTGVEQGDVHLLVVVVRTDLGQVEVRLGARRRGVDAEVAVAVHVGAGRVVGGNPWRSHRLGRVGGARRERGPEARPQREGVRSVLGRTRARRRLHLHEVRALGGVVEGVERLPATSVAARRGRGHGGAERRGRERIEAGVVPHLEGGGEAVRARVTAPVGGAQSGVVDLDGHRAGVVLREVDGVEVAVGVVLGVGDGGAARARRPTGWSPSPGSPCS